MKKPSKEKKKKNSEEPKQQVILPTYYVAIGASAGGLEAIDIFFSTMPALSGLAYVVIQHLSPDFKSLMESTFRSMYFLNPWQKTKEKNLLESFFLELEVMELVV